MIPQNSLKSDFKVSNVAKLEHGLSKNFKRNHLFVQKLKIFNIRWFTEHDIEAPVALGNLHTRLILVLRIYTMEYIYLY